MIISEKLWPQLPAGSRVRVIFTAVSPAPGVYVGNSVVPLEILPFPLWSQLNVEYVPGVGSAV